MSGNATNSGASGKAVSELGSSSSAVSGKIYSCKIVPCYRHPVTNKVEDAGGNGSYATGQGMVESVLKTSGMLEQTDDGQSYLTIRVGLMDYTSDHKFYVQKRGAQSWQHVSSSVTKNGTDDNGKTADYCIPVSDKNCIVKLSMYVQSMGRNVVFYAYAKNFKAGKASGMAVTHVSVNAAASSDENASKSGTYDGTLSETEVNISENDNISISGNTLSDTSSEISESGLSDVQGLSLSTEDESKGSGSDTSGSQTAGTLETASEGNSTRTTGDNNGKSEDMTMAKWVVVLTISITLSGLVIIAAGAGVVYYFRRNWRRWGEEMEDDEE